jgi:hypothetical protein
MTPTPEEKLWLKDYLYQMMEYRETYEEVYDHLVLAVADAPEEKHFESVVASIIARDFGDPNGLYNLEQNCKQAIEISLVIQYQLNLKRWFTTPLAVITIALFSFLLSMQYIKVKVGGILLLLFLLLLLLPVILCAIRGFGIGYKYGKLKTSIKDQIFRRISFRANSTLFSLFVIVKAIDLFTKHVLEIKILPDNNPIVLNIIVFLATTIQVLMILHILSVVKMLYDEFKTGIIAR